jgi:L-fuculose-phosphate aldolase
VEPRTAPGPGRRARLELVAAGASLAAAGLLLPGEGNLSVRVDRTVLITAAGVDKGRLAAADLISFEVGNSSSSGVVSTEVRLHNTIYVRHPAVAAVVHAHPPRVLSLATRNRLPDCRLTIEGERDLEAAVLVGVFPPGSQELADAVAHAIVHAPACVLDRHGAVTVGSTLGLAVRRMLLLERLAGIEGWGLGG